MGLLQHTLSLAEILAIHRGYHFGVFYSIWLYMALDAILAFACYFIAVVLFYFALKWTDFPFRRVCWLLGTFMMACGTTYALEMGGKWFPTDWILGGVKTFAVLVSLGISVELIFRIPSAMKMSSVLGLEVPNQPSQQMPEQSADEAVTQPLTPEAALHNAEHTQVLKRSQAIETNQFRRSQIACSKSENTLEDTTERLNIALSAAQMGSWDWDIEQQQFYCSPKAKEILGFGSDTCPTYLALTERIDPEDRPKFETAIAHAQQTWQGFSEEYRVIWPDQSLHWVSVQGRFRWSPEENAHRMTGVIQEVTKAKQAEIALRASESRFRAVFEQAAVGMARLSAVGEWLQVNQTLCDLLGYTTNELIGQSFRAITDPADHEQDEYYYQQLIRAEIFSCRFEKRYLHKDGTPIWTMVTVSTERTHNDEVTAFIAVIEDIRALKQTREELQQRAAELEEVNNLFVMTTAMLEKRNAELDQFAYVASHDLKAPLRAIANLSEWIEEDLSGQLPEENQHQLSLLRNRVHRMEALINGLLEYSRVGRRERSIETVVIDQLLTEIIDSLSPPETFTISLPTNAPILKTNRVALRQVFSNLTSNAIKHHDRDEGHITITAQDHGNMVEFAVIDDGPGIDPRYHEKVFTIFQTLKARDEFESTGIGLSIVKKIIESEGGTIRLESDLGKGSAFHFTWPK